MNYEATMMTNIPEKKEQPRKITFFFTISLHEPYHWLNAPAARKEREREKKSCKYKVSINT